MREILFKAKCKDNGVWVEGDLVHISEMVYIHRQINWIRHWEYVDPDTVSQFTGLTDKNGAKIWEGDVLKTPNGVTKEVIYNENCAAFMLSSLKYNALSDLLQSQIRAFEVIGNIHETTSSVKRS